MLSKQDAIPGATALRCTCNWHYLYPPDVGGSLLIAVAKTDRNRNTPITTHESTAILSSPKLCVHLVIAAYYVADLSVGVIRPDAQWTFL
ncbi:hypothetical protein BaRGS_00016881 [Batillaria attramentaria]|uniref:Uncharacterized protein n=1 Tax=Batillaria attramentaria TaxID=370345 RepID=A0ABD0KYI9_9CAEN